MSSSKSYLKLTTKQRVYVDCRLDGMTQLASASAAGASSPQRYEENETVQAAMIERMQATADAVDFSRREAHDMYMDAHRNAETATEQIAAISAMVKLHGLEKPKVIEVKHDHNVTGQLEFMGTDELMKLADMTDLVLDAEYEDITDAPELEAPKVTDDNTVEDAPKVPTVSQDY